MNFTTPRSAVKPLSMILSTRPKRSIINRRFGSPTVYLHCSKSELSFLIKDSILEEHLEECPQCEVQIQHLLRHLDALLTTVVDDHQVHIWNRNDENYLALPFSTPEEVLVEPLGLDGLVTFKRLRLKPQ